MVPHKPSSLTFASLLDRRWISVGYSVFALALLSLATMQRAAMIAGFPTEDEAMHANNLSIIADLAIVHGHVFPYSPRPGTPAARMPQVAPATVKARAAELRAAVAEQRAAWLLSLVGTPLRVLAERDGTGHADNFARVRLPNGSEVSQWQTITPTKIIEGMLA